MANLSTLPLKGFRDFLPADARKRAWLRNQLVKVFEKWGYEPLETPTLERQEIFSGQIGEDEKLFFSFKDNGGRDVMLRYDQTVPTCRVVGQYANKIIFPFRRYQIQSNFRAENPQKGRYREFTQADFDIFGVASPTADAEVIALTLDIYRTLGFTEVIALINSRDLISDFPYTAIVSIDKLDKLSENEVIDEMIKKGIAPAQAMIYLKKVRELQPNSDLDVIFNYLHDAGFPNSWYRFEPTLARAFSYSQGPIWEIKIPQAGSLSVGGGERYDNLVEKITGQKIPGTGIAIGFDRTLEALEACNLLPNLTQPTRILVTVFSSSLSAPAQQFSKSLRQAGINTELYPDPNIKLDKQLKYASQKGIPYVAILGPEEVEKNLVTLKNLSTGEQTQLTPDKLISCLLPEPNPTPSSF